MLCADSSCGGVKRDTRCRISNVCLLFSTRKCAPGGGEGAVCLDNALRRNHDLKEWKQPTKQLGPFLPLDSLGHVAQHTWMETQLPGSSEIEKCWCCSQQEQRGEKFEVRILWKRREQLSLCYRRLLSYCSCLDPVSWISKTKRIPPFLLLCACLVLCLKSKSGSISSLL